MPSAAIDIDESCASSLHRDATSPVSGSIRNNESESNRKDI